MPSKETKTDKRLKIGGIVSLVVGVLGAVFLFPAFLGKIPEMAALAGNPVVITFAVISILAAVVGAAFTIHYAAGPDRPDPRINAYLERSDSADSIHLTNHESTHHAPTREAGATETNDARGPIMGSRGDE